MTGTSSEFGRGLLVCLLAFIDHSREVTEHLRMAERSGITLDDPETFYAQLWANGASDHLYEMEVPRHLAGTALATRVLKFKDKWLEIGHGLNNLSAQVTKGDRPFSFAAINVGLEEAKQLCLEIAVELDKTLGVKDAKVGEYT